MSKTTRNSRLYILIIVGILSAFGPFVTDFYLPALPSLSEYFGTTASLAQLSLTFSMIGLAIGQLLIGPLSDKYGRKPLLQYSLLTFCISTVGCLVSTSIYEFVLFRFIQGIAGSGGVVISKSIATDLYKGPELMKFFSLLSSVQGIAPISAPILGGILMETTDWKGIFMILLIGGIVLMAALTFFKESLPVEGRSDDNVLSVFHRLFPLLLHTGFMRYVLVQAFAMGAMFVYIAASPFIFQQHFGASPLTYSVCFGINALGIMIGSLAVSHFRDADSALRIGVKGFCVVSLLVGIVFMTASSVWAVEVSLFVYLVFLGLILPSSTAIALDLERSNSGNASALLGFLMFLFGGVISPLTGLGDILITTPVLFIICSISALLCIRKLSIAVQSK